MVKILGLATEHRSEFLGVPVREHLGCAALKKAVHVTDVAADGDRGLTHVEIAPPQKVADRLSYRIVLHRVASRNCQMSIGYSLQYTIVNDNCLA